MAWTEALCFKLCIVCILQNEAVPHKPSRQLWNPLDKSKINLLRYMMTTTRVFYSLNSKRHEQRKVAMIKAKVERCFANAWDIGAAQCREAHRIHLSLKK